MDDIIHKYKGYEIKKCVRKYSCGTSWTETFYRIINLDINFDKLKEAKQYIDFMDEHHFIITTDNKLESKNNK